MARRGRRTGLSKQETRGLIALIAALILVFIKVVEYSFKAVAWGLQHVSDDVKWSSEGIQHYKGHWKSFYVESLHRKVFKYIALICLLIGLFLLPNRPIATSLFIGAASISYFIDRDVFATLGHGVKEILIAILVASGLVSNGLYQKHEVETAERERAEMIKQRQQELAFQKKQAAILDSSNKLVTLGRSAFIKKKYKAANALFDQALTLSPTNSNALYLKGLYYKETKQPAKALELFTQIGPNSEKYDEALIEQGLWLIRKGDKAAAVAKFKEASTANIQGEKLYNKYNPIRKRIIGYVTRCCDGTSSSATGRGACSHHGGVCNWNDPIYSESRKYD